MIGGSSMSEYTSIENPTKILMFDRVLLCFFFLLSLVFTILKYLETPAANP